MTTMIRSTCALLAILSLTACVYEERPPYRGWHHGYYGGHYGWYDERGGWRGDYYHHRW
ncbi:hypothetical protein ACLRDC_10535 [Gluconacetobacter sacchari]|uniref:Lipoprotein n=2 Tax=Gluconacetobacter sacchari TaxID=92759 RepID=A0A7W4NK20_9PROT|nr:hypothetical protein [Gluconacetobacter sacchari]MBB2159239.1 hypothetical protein [Gluconacetobacter sacchari]GBQ23907.1 hypothetical protein AA12717_1627 [Gluconacetobacter sacchari DSM 12717]